MDRKLVEVNERWAHHEADLKQQQNDVVELSSPADSSGSTLQFESDEVQVVADSQPQAGISTSAFSVPIQRRKLFNPKANAFKEECEMV